MMNHVAGAIFLLLVLIGASLLWCIPASKDRSSPDLMEKRLANLGYITRTPTDTESGTRVHDRNAMAPGVNLYCSETGTTATFVNADGKHLAAARFSISETRYQSNLCKVVKPWLHDLAMVVEYSAVARFNMKTGPRWALQGAFHHDIAIDGERLFAMADASRVINFADQTYPIVDTQIVEVSSQGLIRRSW